MKALGEAREEPALLFGLSASSLPRCSPRWPLLAVAASRRLPASLCLQPHAASKTPCAGLRLCRVYRSRGSDGAGALANECWGSDTGEPSWLVDRKRGRGCPWRPGGATLSVRFSLWFYRFDSSLIFSSIDLYMDVEGIDFWRLLWRSLDRCWFCARHLICIRLLSFIWYEFSSIWYVTLFWTHIEFGFGLVRCWVPALFGNRLATDWNFHG